MPKKKHLEETVELDPSIIYFTFSRIRGVFSCGRTIASTRDQFLRRELNPRDLPLLLVFTDDAGNYYSQNNRRLFLYKELRTLGALQSVPVMLRKLPDTRRMREKYTPEKCSLRATLKREGGTSSSQAQKQKLNSDEHYETEEEEEEGEGACEGWTQENEKVKESATETTVDRRVVVAPSSHDGGNIVKSLISYNEDNHNTPHSHNQRKKAQRREQQNRKCDGDRRSKTLEEELRELGV